MKFIDSLIDDIRTVVTLILTIMILLAISNLDLKLLSYLPVFRNIYYLIMGIDAILLIISIIVGIVTSRFGSVAFDVFANGAIIAGAYFLMKYINSNIVDLGANYLVCILITTSFLATAISSISEFDFSDALGSVEAFVESVRIIAIFSVVVLLFTNKLNIYQFNMDIVKVYTWIVIIVLAFDLILVVVDLIMGLGDFSFGDFLTILLNIVVFGSFLVGYFFSNKIIGVIGIDITLTSFNEKIAFAFIMYFLVDLTLSIPLNAISSLFESD